MTSGTLELADGRVLRRQVSFHLTFDEPGLPPRSSSPTSSVRAGDAAVKSRLRSALAAAVLGTIAAAAGAAWTTAPGQNGKLVFRRYLNPQRTTGALFTANPDGRGMRQLTHPGKTGLDNEPDWSPDGTKVVYEHSTGPRDELIYIVNANGTGPRSVVPCTGGCAGQEAPAWSPNGTEIAFASGGVKYEQIWIVGVDGTNLRRLTKPNGLDADPQWSPDGHRIVFRRIDPFRPRKGYALFGSTPTAGASDD